MKAYNKTIGAFGEELAENYLEQMGYQIIVKNFRCRIGEIDIIAKDKDYIVFMEVKTRYNDRYGHPCEAVTAHKQYKIYKTAQFYIMVNKLHNFNFRFDVIEVILNYDNDNNYIRLIKNAFIL